jgi:hypothetical protein
MNKYLIFILLTLTVNLTKVNDFTACWVNEFSHILRAVTDVVFYRLLLADSCVAEIVA